MFVIEDNASRWHGPKARGVVYIRKGGGCNTPVRNPNDATHFATKEAAHDARPGHHKDMGGNGYHGRVVTLESARRLAEARRSRRW